MRAPSLTRETVIGLMVDELIHLPVQRFRLELAARQVLLMLEQKDLMRDLGPYWHEQPDAINNGEKT